MNHWEPSSAVSSFSLNGNMTSLNGGPGPEPVQQLRRFPAGRTVGHYEIPTVESNRNAGLVWSAVPS
jgi:hypothetical protein